ncbi:hypothetical protein ACQRIT_005538 [Beauveria bassiana]
MSAAAEPPPATTSTTSATPGNNVSPLTYVIIPLVTLASVFLVGLFAYVQRRRSRRHAFDSNGDGGEAQMQEYRRGADTGSAADRWPPASLAFNWWFLRSNEGLNELGEAPPPYIAERRNKVTSEGTANGHVIEEDEDEDEDEEENGGPGRSRESMRQSASIGVWNGTSQQSGNGTRSREEPTQASTQEEEEEAQQHIHDAVVEPQENNEQVLPAETSASLPFTTAAAPSDLSSSASPARDNPRRPSSEIASIMESRRLRSQLRRSPRAATTTSTSTSTSSTDDICSSEFFRSRSTSPERSDRRHHRRHHIERLNRRLRRLGYVTPETIEYHGLQLRDMEDGAAPPTYERVPDVAVPPPAQLPPPPAADAPPPYPAAAPRWQRPPILILSAAPRRRREEGGGPPMVPQQTTLPPHHEQFLGRHYLFMPPLEPDYPRAGFSASLDMPRQLHSRF